MPRPKPERTEIASAAVLLADMFALAFESLIIPGDTPRKARLAQPEGPSTMGGTQARQHITLSAEQGELRSLTVGWVDIPKREAELRTFGYLREMHQQRFGDTPFVLDEAYFQVFFDRAQSFLSEHGFLVKVRTRPQSSMLPPPRPARRVATVVMVLLFLAVLAAGAYWRLALH
jgi:hypothetical protein